MKSVLKGNLIAFAIFAGAFALHVVGGATDQGWLFAIAVALIFWSAIDFPALALRFSGGEGRTTRRTVFALGAVVGVALTSGALWAAADRSWQVWTVPLAVAFVVGCHGLRAVIPARRRATLPGRATT